MIKATRLSTVRFINEVMSGFSPPDGIGLQYIDWDDHADITKLPSGDLIGLNGFGITENDGTFGISFGVGLSSFNDQNLFRLTDYVDVFYRAMCAQKQYPIFHPITGAAVGTATFERGTTASPIARVETRPLYMILAHAVVAMDPELTQGL
jgi:hypothetical protein